jgi:hypothetical protein
MQLLPRLLFRGDSDKLNKRLLKSTFKSELFMTNLISGGIGREIFSNTIGQLLNRHIATGWDKTHFLSFSTDEQRAFYYGSDGKPFDDVYYETENWDFAVLTFDTTLLIQDSIKEVDAGIYSAKFIPTCKEFLPTFKVILIDAVSHLKSIASKSNIDMKTAIANADNDKEWLILPVSPFNHQGELTAKLDAHCITDKRLYRYE